MISPTPIAFFVTNRDDAHVRRITTAIETEIGRCHLVYLKESAGSVKASFQGRELTGWDEISSAIDSQRGIVFSGPLDSVSSRLSIARNKHLGISWSTDVMLSIGSSVGELIRVGQSLRKLDLVLVDNYHCENAIVAMGVQRTKIIRFSWLSESQEYLNRMPYRAGAASEGSSFLFLRGLDEHYRPVQCLRTFSRLREEGHKISLTFIGHQTANHRLAKITSNASHIDWVKWENPMDETGFVKFMRKFTAVINFPKTDGSSVSVLQAMVQGVPVISTMTAGSAEWIIEGITGWTARGNAECDLYEATLRFLHAEPEELRLVTENAKRLVRSKVGLESGIRAVSEALFE